MMDENPIKDENIKFWLHRKGWTLLAPAYQWTEWTVMLDDGSIIPLNLEMLKERFESDPLSKDETAQYYRSQVFKLR